MSNQTIKELKVMSSFSTTDYRKERLFGEACNQYLEKHGIPRERFLSQQKKEYIPNVGEVTIESEPMFEVIGNPWDNPELLKEVE